MPAPILFVNNTNSAAHVEESMANKTTMPDPVVVKYATKLGKYTTFQSADSRVRKKEALYTDDQMEAYANARVREALEDAASMADDVFALSVGDSIRALMPKE